MHPRKLSWGFNVDASWTFLKTMKMTAGRLAKSLPSIVRLRKLLWVSDLYVHISTPYIIWYIIWYYRYVYISTPLYDHGIGFRIPSLSFQKAVKKKNGQKLSTKPCVANSVPWDSPSSKTCELQPPVQSQEAPPLAGKHSTHRESRRKCLSTQNAVQKKGICDRSQEGYVFEK